MSVELCFDVLDDLSDELEVSDFYNLLMINDLVYELEYKIVRRIEYYHEVYEWVELHEISCGINGSCNCIEVRNFEFHVCFKGDLNALMWLRNSTEMFTSPEWNMLYAIAGGQLKVAQWIYENFGRDGLFEESEGFRKGEVFEKAMIYACCNNYLDTAIWLRDMQLTGDVGCSFWWASRNGHTNMVRWLFQNYKINNKRLKESVETARANGHNDIVEYITDKIKN